MSESLHPGQLKTVALVLAIVQLPLLCVLFWGDFGFMFPGPMGTLADFSNWLLAYLILLVVGLAIAVHERKYVLAISQLFAPLTMYGILCGYEAIPEPQYDAANYLHLKGMNIKEAEQEVGAWWRRPRYVHSLSREWNEETQSNGPEVGQLHYNGMIVEYSEDWTVIDVRED